MKTLPIGLQAHLDTKATTLCWCWRLTRTDNASYGFTDHDNDLVFDNTTFEASSGFTASDVEDQIGLAVSNLDVQGALNSTRLNENDLAAGVFDNAAIELYRVNWADVSQRILMRKGSLGEVKRGEVLFTAEVRGLAHNLQQPKGRVYQFTCDADLGDSRCGVNLESAALKSSGTVTNLNLNNKFRGSGLHTFADDYFTRGTLTWLTGHNANRSMEVKLHTRLSTTFAVGVADAEIELWHNMSEPIQLNDTFEIRAGCDKVFATCQTKFNNVNNYRGFPHMPGNDFVTSYPNSDDTDLDGGSFFI
ncbi:MAG: DUF2163 domain-containing protein [Pseudomonadota bacterium]